MPKCNKNYQKHVHNVLQELRKQTKNGIVSFMQFCTMYLSQLTHYAGVLSDSGMTVTEHTSLSKNIIQKEHSCAWQLL
jgi:hypothetical protein